METDSKFQCDFCNKSFQRETSLFSHVCETKRRWQQRELIDNRLGFQTWLEFYRRNTNSKKQKTYIDFAKSAYYIAFVKFGKYCADIKCVSVNRYADWLLHNQIRIDDWCKDSLYDRFLKDHLKDEDPYDAIARSIETTIEFAKNEYIASNDYLRYGNKNRICSLIVNGKISPWLLYQSESGIKFLENIDTVQQQMILDYINPEQWAIKFKRNQEIVSEVKELLNAAGY